MHSQVFGFRTAMYLLGETVHCIAESITLQYEHQEGGDHRVRPGAHRAK